MSAVGDLLALAPRLPRLFDAIETIAARTEAAGESRRRRRSVVLPLWVGALSLAVIAAASLGWL